MKSIMRIFNINRNNRLSTCKIVDGTNKGRFVHVAYWISGRILGKYISINIPIPKIFQEKLAKDERFYTEKEWDEMFPDPT